MTNVVAEISKNPVLSNVLGLLVNQTEKGFKKYGHTVDAHSLEAIDWIDHASEEAIDFVVYLQSLKLKLLQDTPAGSHVCLFCYSDQAAPVKNGPIKKPRKKKQTNYIPAKNGVRVIKGVPLYKCSYICHNEKCKDRGIRYIDDKTDTVKCHKCKTELSVFPSTANEAHDDEYNYFTAY